MPYAANTANRAGYRETELGWLPEEWKVLSLQEAVESIEYGHSISIPKNESINGIPIISTADITKNGNILYHQIRKIIPPKIVKERLIVTDGDILFNWRNSPELIGKTAVYKKQTMSHIYASFILRIRCKEDVSYNHYLSYLLNYYREKGVFVKLSRRAVNQANYNRNEIYVLQIPLPPLPEQRRIAAVLAAIQEARDRTAQVITALQAFKKSLMQHLFTYGPARVDAVEQVKLQETEIGLMPEGWEIAKIGDVFDVQQGKQLSAKEKPDGKTQRPFLRTSNVFWGRIDLSKVDEMYFTEDEVQKLKLQANDILLCEGGDVGRTVIWHEEIKNCLYQNHLHRLRPKTPNYEPDFFANWMEYAILQQKMYIMSANRTTIPNLSQSRLKEFQIPLPPLSIQRQIAAILSAVDEKIEKETNQQHALHSLFQSMLDALMTAKLRVSALEV